MQAYFIINILEPLLRGWIANYPRIFGEESLIKLPDPLTLIITGLCSLVEIKSQGGDFPFQTHPRSINVALASLLVYGFTSALEHFVSATGLAPISVYAIIARLGRIGCLFIMIASLASLFCV